MDNFSDYSLTHSLHCIILRKPFILTSTLAGANHHRHETILSYRNHSAKRLAIGAQLCAMDIVKLSKLLNSAHNAYSVSNQQRLKIPIDMAQFALTEKVTPQVRTYLCAQSLFSGKAPATARPLKAIADYLSLTERTVYRHFDWLIERNWIGKDSEKGWYFIRGINFVKRIEKFKHRQSVWMMEADFHRAKEFFTGAVINSICKTRMKRTERKKGRSLQSFIPISLMTLEKVFRTSRKTAFTYRKKASGKYYTMVQNLTQVRGIDAIDIKRMKHSHIDSVTLQMFGSIDTITARPEQLRTQFGRVFVQLPNLIRPAMFMCSRSHSDVNNNKYYLRPALNSLT